MVIMTNAVLIMTAIALVALTGIISAIFKTALTETAGIEYLKIINGMMFLTKRLLLAEIKTVFLVFGGIGSITTA